LTQDFGTPTQELNLANFDFSCFLILTVKLESLWKMEKYMCTMQWPSLIAKNKNELTGKSFVQLASNHFLRNCESRLMLSVSYCDHITFSKPHLLKITK